MTASIVGLKRAALIELLERDNAERALPIQLNWMGPSGLVVIEEGKWTIRCMGCNEERAEEEHQRRISEGDDAWAPEDTWPFQEPAEVLVQTDTKEELIAAIKAMEWPFTPDDYPDEGPVLRSAKDLLRKK